MGGFRCSEHLRYAGGVQVIVTLATLDTCFSTILLGPDLAFSTLQHRLALFRTLPEIPIFVLARPVLDFLLVGIHSIVSSFTSKPHTGDGVSASSAIPLASLHICTDTAFNNGNTSFIQQHHHIQHSIFASTQPGAVSSLAHHTNFLLLCFPKATKNKLNDLFNQPSASLQNWLFSLRLTFSYYRLRGERSFWWLFLCTESI